MNSVEPLPPMVPLDACTAIAGIDCSKDQNYKVVYTSASNAFPGGGFRPKVPQLTNRSFTIRPTLATHLRLRALHSQCTGGELYRGEQDNDPRSATDCGTASPSARQLRASARSRRGSGRAVPSSAYGWEFTPVSR